MSVETILPWIMSECGLDVSAPDISSNDYQMRQIAALMNAAGKDINTRAQWTAAQTAEAVSSGVGGWNIPSDYQEMVSGASVVMQTSPVTFLRPMTDPNMIDFLTSHPPEIPYYCISAGFVYFMPPVTATTTINYISKNWLNFRTKAEVTDNADTPIFSEDLLARGTIWRWRRQKGLPYEDLMAEFEADLEAAIQADRGV